MAECEAELVRLQNIERNKKFMASLGLENAVASLQVVAVKSSRKSPLNGGATRNAKKQKTVSEQPQPRRCSSRLKGMTPKNYSDKALDMVDQPIRWRRFGETVTRPEVYDEHHLKQLGSYKEEWTLFVDGFAISGDFKSRQYDKALGETCHQCRQKTMGLRTRCTTCHQCQQHNPQWIHEDSACVQCGSLPCKKGFYCGDCLWMRYGENVKEARQNPHWKCPICRDICNCSGHGCLRHKNGWGATGCMYREAVAQGYASVAHYLVKTRQKNTLE